MSEERNPDRDCPFCGGKPSVRNWHDNERNGYAEHWQVSCKSCMASTASSQYMPYGEWVGGGKPNIQQDRDVQEQIAHDNWNRRVIPSKAQ